MKFGYQRVSTREQDFSLQTDALIKCRNEGICYKGYADGLLICINQNSVHLLNSYDFTNVYEGKAFNIHSYTPVLFDPKQPPNK